MNEAVLILYFITAIPGMVRYKKLSMPFKLLSIYFVFHFLINTASVYYVARFNTNAVLFHLDTLGNFVFFSSIYYCLFKDNKLKTGILVLIAVYSIFLILNGVFWQPFNSAFPSIPLVTGAVLLMVYALLLFKQMLLYPLQVKITHQSVFWFNMAIFFFSTLMFLNYSLINYYAHHNVHNMLLGYFWHFMDVSLSVLLFVAILTDKKETNSVNA